MEFDFIVNYFVTLYLGSLVIGLVLILPLERIFPFRKQRHFEKNRISDLLHYLVDGFIINSGIAVIIAVTWTLTSLALVTLSGRGITFIGKGLYLAQSTIAQQSIYLQVIELLFVTEIAAYLAHRLAHRWGWWWRFHAIHHSGSDAPDWLAAQRVHPIDRLLNYTFMIVPIKLLGFTPETGLILGVINLAEPLLHANVGFRFGLLNYLFVTPEFHRWHHSSDRKAYQKNFASRLPLLDLIFGTFYLPAGVTPERFGILDPVPQDYFKQLISPFRARTELYHSLTERQRAFLAQLAREIAANSGTPGDEEKIVRALLASLAEVGIDSSQVRSTEEMKMIIAARLAG